MPKCSQPAAKKGQTGAGSVEAQETLHQGKRETQENLTQLIFFNNTCRGVNL